jgi:pimeloyl-ACP methyl ester carboxylesterase
MSDHARHCGLLLHQLGIERAHVVGHSSSAVVAMQLAFDFPDAVGTLALLEPARPALQTELQAAFVRNSVEPAVQRFRASDTAGAVDTRARGVFGADYRGALERGLPGIGEQCVADADAFFTQELPALERWTFTREPRAPARAGRAGREHGADLPERVELLSSWLPNVERFDLPGATHMLHLQNPAGMAEGLASFYGRHSLGDVGDDGATWDTN